MPRQHQTNYASQEFETSYNELMDLSPHQALKHFHARHDELIEDISEDASPAKVCSKGCDYCCYLKVVVDAVEVFSMLEAIRDRLNTDQIEQVLNTALSNREEAKNLTHEQQATINQKCPLLFDGGCAIYDQRSIKCRNYHSTDNSSCQASYQNPTDLTILNQHIPELYVAATGSGDGFLAALHMSGYDDRLYDLNAALIEAYNDPACKQRYESQQTTFNQVKFNNQ